MCSLKHSIPVGFRVHLKNDIHNVQYWDAIYHLNSEFRYYSSPAGIWVHLKYDILDVQHHPTLYLRHTESTNDVECIYSSTIPIAKTEHA